MERTVVASIIVFTAFASFLLGWYSKPSQKLSETENTAEDKTGTAIDSFDLQYPEYHVYGIRQEKDRQRHIVDNLYKFRFTIVGGCIVDDETRIEAEKQNKKTNKTMSARYGKDWLEKFEQSVDSLYTIDSTAIAIAKRSLEFKKLQADSIRIKNLEYIAYPTYKDNIKLVRIFGDEGISQIGTTYDYLRVTVDISKKTVLNIDKQEYQYR